MDGSTTERSEAEQPGCFVLFSTTSSLLSMSIRWATQSVVSHVSIAFESATTGRVLVLEAAGGGFRSITWERWQRENELISMFRIDVPSAQWREGLGDFCDTLGKPYDTPRLLREAARHLTQGWTLRFPWAHPQKNASGVLCADAVAVFLQKIGLSQFDFPLTWTPGALLDFASADQTFIRMTPRVRTMPFKPALSAEPSPTQNTPYLEIVR